jgi:hypothetical protein
MQWVKFFSIRKDGMIMRLTPEKEHLMSKISEVLLETLLQYLPDNNFFSQLLNQMLQVKYVEAEFTKRIMSLVYSLLSFTLSCYCS